MVIIDIDNKGFSPFFYCLLFIRTPLKREIIVYLMLLQYTLVSTWALGLYQTRRHSAQTDSWAHI